MDENEVMRPVKKNIKLSLIKTVPAGYPIAKLKEQLTSLNLICDETSEEELKRYKKEVRKKSGQAINRYSVDEKHGK